LGWNGIPVSDCDDDCSADHGLFLPSSLCHATIPLLTPYRCASSAPC
jgi:hypothetical protein